MFRIIKKKSKYKANKKVDSHNGSCLCANFAPLMADLLPSAKYVNTYKEPYGPQVYLLLPVFIHF